MVRGPRQRDTELGPNGADEKGRTVNDAVPAGSPRSDDVVASFPYRGIGDSKSLVDERKRFDEAIEKLKVEASKSLPTPNGH